MSPPEQLPPSPERSRLPSSKTPLYLRLYFQTHLTEIVRAMGYGDTPAAQARERLTRLMERFDREKVLDAATELLEFDDEAEPPVARLKAEVAKLSFQLLGPPPKPKAQRAAALAPNAAGTRAKQMARPVNMPRYHVMKKYEEHLIAEKLQCSTHAELRKSMPFLEMLPVLDYLVTRKQSHLLVTVRPNLRGNQAAQMIAYSDALLANHAAVRIWPAEGAGGWVWQEHELFAEPFGIDPKRFKLSLDDWRTVHEHADGDRKCKREWVTGGCACPCCRAARAILTATSAKRSRRA